MGALTHTFEKFSGVCRQRVLGRHVHLPASQELADCPVRSVEDLPMSLFLLFSKHFQNFPAFSPRLFESEEAVGQIFLRWPFSYGPSRWEANVEVDIFLDTGA